MGRIHRYGQRHDCLIFNFVATNTIEGRVLERLLDKLQEIRDALDDDAVFNVVGEVLPAAQIERVLRDYYAGKLGEADLEDRLLHDVDEDQFRAICQNALEGLASRKLNLEMLIERRAQGAGTPRRPGDDRPLPGRCRHGSRRSPCRAVPALPHTFDPGRTPTVLRNCSSGTRIGGCRLGRGDIPGCRRDRETADANNLEWVTPGHPLFEAVRAHTLLRGAGRLGQPAPASIRSTTTSPARLDFYRARVVDGLGHTVHERLFAVEIDADGEARFREPSILGDLTLGSSPDELPTVAHCRRRPIR